MLINGSDSGCVQLLGGRREEQVCKLCQHKNVVNGEIVLLFILQNWKSYFAEVIQ